MHRWKAGALDGIGMRRAESGPVVEPCSLGSRVSRTRFRRCSSECIVAEGFSLRLKMLQERDHGSYPARSLRGWRQLAGKIFRQGTRVQSPFGWRRWPTHNASCGGCAPWASVHRTRQCSHVAAILRQVCTHAALLIPGIDQPPLQPHGQEQ